MSRFQVRCRPWPTSLPQARLWCEETQDEHCEFNDRLADGQIKIYLGLLSIILVGLKTRLVIVVFLEFVNKFD